MRHAETIYGGRSTVAGKVQILAVFQPADLWCYACHGRWILHGKMALQRGHWQRPWGGYFERRAPCDDDTFTKATFYVAMENDHF